MEVREGSDSLNTSMEAGIDPLSKPREEALTEKDEIEFGPWMLVSRRRGFGGGRDGAGGGAGCGAGRPVQRVVQAWPTEPTIITSNALP